MTRTEFMSLLQYYLKKSSAEETADIIADYNAHFDVAEDAGFSDEERAKMTELLAAGFTDTFRHLYPDAVKYSWWSYRFKARERNAGWRIDYFLVSNRIAGNVKDSLIYDTVTGSDHCPIGLQIEF